MVLEGSITIDNFKNLSQALKIHGNYYLQNMVTYFWLNIKGTTILFIVYFEQMFVVFCKLLYIFDVVDI